MWHCPHCGAPQAETARCWVCRRSSTTCSTCRHFRASLKADVGWCALDPKRLPLTGLEQRGCWQERGAGVAMAGAPETPAGRRRRARDASEEDTTSRAPARDFVPVELLGAVVITAAPGTPDASVDPPLPTVAQLPTEAEPSWAERTSLFGDAEA